MNQDIQSTIKLVYNGKSNSELTRHIQIGYYSVKDSIIISLTEVSSLLYTAQLNSWLLIFLPNHFRATYSTRCGRKLLVYPLYKLPSNYNLWKFILTILCLIFTLNLSSQKKFIFRHNFYNITVCEYLSYSTSSSLPLREYNVGVC